MTLAVHGHQVGEIDSGIDLGCCQRGVAQELLDGPKIHARLEKVSGKCMPQGMGVELVVC